MDDHYNNLKVYEPKVKGMSSLNSSIQNIAFVSSSNNNSTNGIVNTAQAVNNAQVVNTAQAINTSCTQVNTANIDNLSGVVICIFLAGQPSSPQLVNENLEQIHPDDLEEIDLRWQMSMLTMRAIRFLKNRKEADCQCNVTPDLPDMCEDDIQNKENDVESDDEHVALANLIANLKLDVDENKKIQKQLKKANTSLAQELRECKAILAET
nr:hypothetical protein [Tanacetum cinerariifolium]